jgi:hypothetical protein
MVGGEAQVVELPSKPKAELKLQWCQKKKKKVIRQTPLLQS